MPALCYFCLYKSVKIFHTSVTVQNRLIFAENYPTYIYNFVISQENHFFVEVVVLYGEWHLCFNNSCFFRHSLLQITLHVSWEIKICGEPKLLSDLAHKIWFYLLLQPIMLSKNDIHNIKINITRWDIHQYADKNNGHINECCVCRRFKMGTFVSI